MEEWEKRDLKAYKHGNWEGIHRLILYESPGGKQNAGPSMCPKFLQGKNRED